MLLPLLMNNLLGSGGGPVIPVAGSITVPLPGCAMRVMRPLWVTENPEDTLVVPNISGSYQ